MGGEKGKQQPAYVKSVALFLGAMLTIFRAENPKHVLLINALTRNFANK